MGVWEFPLTSSRPREGPLPDGGSEVPGSRGMVRDATSAPPHVDVTTSTDRSCLRAVKITVHDGE